jgi:hypothetical protein
MQGNNQENYVVRIFRSDPGRGEADNTHLDGIVENPCTGQRNAFHTSEELWEVLVNCGNSAASRKRKPVGKVTYP